MRVDFTKQGVGLNVSASPDAVSVRADPRALQQALLNLVTNALDSLKGRPDPRVELRVFKAGAEVFFRVEDNGCGIPEDKLRNIFKPFYTTKKHGTGLGLVIVKKMITRMNGAIEIRSRKDSGTIIDIILPEGADERQ